MLKLGKLELSTTRPDDLDVRLVASTGCSSAEIGTLLGAGPDLIARAIRPFLAADAPDHSAVARAVASDMDAARDAVRKLYEAAPDADPVAEASEAGAVVDTGVAALDLTGGQPAVFGYDAGGADLHRDVTA